MCVCVYVCVDLILGAIAKGTQEMMEIPIAAHAHPNGMHCACISCGVGPLQHAGAGR